MPPLPPTARALARLSARANRRTEYVDPRTPGLALRVTPSGTRTWTLHYRIGRHLRRLTLGRYPIVSLAEARRQARRLLGQVAQGHDPAAARQAARQAETIGELAEAYLAQHAKPRKRSWKQDAWMLRREILPAWRHRRAADITRGDVRALVETAATRGPIYANRVRALLHTLFAFAVARDIVPTNPVTGTPRPGVERARDRVLTEAEIRALWAATETLAPPLRAAFRLRLLTAQRGGEVVGMRWADVDLDNAVWTIPGDQTKNGLPHRVPLSPPALAILRALRAEVDAAAAASPDRPAPVYVLRGARGTRQRGQAAKAIPVPDFRGHDLRRTAASYMASIGVPRLVIGKILNHVERGVTAVYDRHGYDAEKRQALDRWAHALERLLAGRPRATLVAVPAGAPR